jgi:elongation factor Ts
MADITATMVKDLREKTGAGMLDCRNALNETKGDMEAAIDVLRKKGLSKAAKKASNVAAEGLVGVTAHGGTGAVVEVNSQTDFVARNAEFQDLVSKIAGLALKAEGNRDKLAQAPFPGAGSDVDARIKALAGTIGENIVLRRTASLHVSPGLVASYVHNQSAPGLGRLGVLVALNSSGNPEKLAALGRQLAMHIAGTPTPPLALKAEQIDPALVEREKAIFADQARA